MLLQVDTEITFAIGDEQAAIHDTAAGGVLHVGLGEVVLQLVSSVEAVMAPTTTIECWTEEDLVVVLLHMALELVVPFEEGDASTTGQWAAQTCGWYAAARAPF